MQERAGREGRGGEEGERRQEQREKDISIIVEFWHQVTMISFLFASET